MVDHDSDTERLKRHRELHNIGIPTYNLHKPVLDELAAADKLIDVLYAHMTDEQKERIKLDLENRGTPDDHCRRRQTIANAWSFSALPNGSLPPASDTSAAFMQESVRPSDDVLVKVRQLPGWFLGRYLYAIEEWQVNGFTGDVEVTEWHPLPEHGVKL